MAFFIFSSILVTLLPLSTLAANNVVPALYVFGDSIVDSGNNNYLQNKAQANHYPYGIDFEGGQPTGRYTNGKTIVDFIAEYLGLPLAPPYLGLKKAAKKTYSATGINYASGGSGILKDTGLIAGQVLPMETQITLFKKTFKKYLPEEKDLEAHLANSIIYISTFGNDYTVNYFFNPNMTAKYTSESFAEYLLGRYMDQLEQLYDLGARKFVLTHGVPTLCSPGPDFKLSCQDIKVTAVNLYNKLFDSKIKALQDKLPDFSYTTLLLDVFYADASANAARYGFDWNRPCCSISQVGGCEEKPPCEDRNKFAKFDVVHPTQIVHELMAKGCIYGSLCKPLSLAQLVDIKA